jgi:cob(I)alamin adenosyltransferase
MTIYTKTGDDGTTALFGGKRVLKCEELVDVYGSIDELNSWMGLLVSEVKPAGIRKLLELIQSDLFLIGSSLAGWKGDLQGLDSRVGKMETEIDNLARELPELNNFIIPGGNELAAKFHIVRSICRRVERQTVALRNNQNLEFGIGNRDYSIVIKYLNRLSDLLFMLARFINSESNVPEIIWNGKTKV